MAHHHAVAALETAHIGLFWNVLPEGFATSQGLLWVAHSPLPPTPEKMFEGGVRMLGVLPGLTIEELGDLARMIHGDLTPWNDFATFLRSSHLPHVVYRLDATKPGAPEHPSLSVETTMSGKTDVMSMIQALTTEDPALRAVLMQRLGRVALGHEAELGALLPRAKPELAEMLLQVLSAVDSDAARDAIRRARENDSPVVRVIALSYDPAAEGELRDEIRSALSAIDPNARLELLVALAAHKVVAGASALVLRVSSGSFDMLPVAERRQAFVTLGALLPARAETLATGLLRDQRVISTEAHEITRELACEALGRIGRSRETRDALLAAVSDRERTSERVWVAAEAALIAFDARAAALP